MHSIRARDMRFAPPLRTLQLKLWILLLDMALKSLSMHSQHSLGLYCTDVNFVVIFLIVEWLCAAASEERRVGPVQFIATKKKGMGAKALLGHLKYSRDTTLPIEQSMVMSMSSYVRAQAELMWSGYVALYSLETTTGSYRATPTTEYHQPRRRCR